MSSKAGSGSALESTSLLRMTFYADIDVFKK